MKKLLFIAILLPFVSFAQENPLLIFAPLKNSTWQAEGTWQDGSKFKQEVRCEFSLNNKLVKVQTWGYTNQAQTTYGLRNEGIRQYNAQSKKIDFWEFDILGNTTHGIVIGQGKNIIYKYQYQGTVLTEMWIYKSKTSYDFIVGIYADGVWMQKFLETTFTSKN